MKTLVATFESDWVDMSTRTSVASQAPEDTCEPEDAAVPEAISGKEVEKAVQVFTKELTPLSISVKKAVRKAVARAGEDLLNDTDIKDTMKKVVKRAVKEAVTEAVQDARNAQAVKESSSQP